MRSTDVNIGLAREIAVRPGAADESEQLGLVPILRIDLGRDLLGEHVERRLRHDQPVEFAAIDAVDQSRALDEIVIGKREQTALRLAADAVAGAADALQEGRDRARRAELADQIHIADIDAELERRGRHHGGQLTLLQALLGVQPLLFGQAAMMRGHAHIAKAV